MPNHSNSIRTRQTSRLLVSACLSMLCATHPLSGEAYRQFRVDARRQPVPPSRGMGPFPASNYPGHSLGFPVVLKLVIATGKLEKNGTGLVDFVITNVGNKAIRLPASADQNIPHTQVLTLYISGARGNGPVDLITSAEMYGDDKDHQTFCFLAPGRAMRVHASTRFRLTPGRHSLTAHAELLKLVGGTSQRLGTAESGSIQKIFKLQTPAP